MNEWVGKSTSWLTALLVVLVFIDVFAQKIFNFSQSWLTEIEWHLFSMIFLLGAGYALKHGKHVRVDLFYEKFSKRDKALVDFWGTLLFLIPWAAAIIWFSSIYAMESFQISEGSPQPNGLPVWYPIKFIIVIGFCLLLLEAIAMLIDSILVLKKEKPSANDHLDYGD